MIESFLVGTVVGAVLFFIFAMKLLSRTLEREDAKLAKLEELFKEKSALSVPVNVEEVDGVFYIYSAGTQEFLAQGSSSQEILAHLNTRMPNAHVIHVIKGEPDVIQRLKSTIQAN